MTEETQGRQDLLTQLKENNAARCPSFGHDLDDWSLTDWATATSGEMGELCDQIKKVRRGDHTLDRANAISLIADEAADVVIYLDLLCQRAGVDLRSAIVKKFNQVSVEKGVDYKLV